MSFSVWSLKVNANACLHATQMYSDMFLMKKSEMTEWGCC